MLSEQVQFSKPPSSEDDDARSLDEVMGSLPNSPQIDGRKSRPKFEKSMHDRVSDDISQALILQRMSNYLEEDQIVYVSRTSPLSRFYKVSKYPRKFCSFLYLFISFFQRPCWCNYDEYEDQCRMNKSNGAMIPTSNTMYFPLSIYYLLEILLVAFIAFNKFAKYMSTVRAIKQQRLFWGIVTVAIFIIAADLFVLWNQNSQNLCFGMFLKPLFFVLCNRLLRQLIVQYVKIFNKGKAVLCLLLFNIIFFAGLGKVLFLNSPITDNFFNTFWGGAYNLYILMTTVNFPDIMLPFYIDTRWASLFFIVFQLMNTILLFNMVLAVFYTAFKSEMEKSTLALLARRDSQHFLRLSNRYFQMIKSSKLRTASLQKQINVSQVEFLELIAQKPSKLIEIVDSKCFELVMEGISVANFIMIYLFNDDEYNNMAWWGWSNFTLNVIFMAEDFVLIFIIGTKFFLKIKNVLSLTISTSLVALSLTLIYTGNQVVLTLILYLMLYRIVRILNLVMRYTQLQQIIISFVNFVPYFGELFGIVFMLFLVFIAIGQHLFGGKMNSLAAVQLSDAGLSADYIYNNFNDFSQGLVLCWDLLIVNNWNIIAQTYTIIMGSQGYVVFFIVFHIVAVLLTLNITVAFLIDFLVKRYDAIAQAVNAY